MGTYYELKISINPEISEIISDICFEKLDCQGIVTSEESYKNLELINKSDTELKVYLGAGNFDMISKVLRQAKKDLAARGLSEAETGSLDFTLEEKQDEDWSRKWKEKWDVTHIGKDLCIVPSWINYSPKRDEVIIKLDPGSAFGTGTHPTTQLCVLGLQKYLQPYSRVADIGTGSGILAIYAKKLGATYVYGCDNDENVISVARENALKNNVQCLFQCNTADRITEKFDFICANILHNVLIDIMTDLKSIMVNNSKLVLSGILNEKKKDVAKVAKNNGLELIDELNMGDWTALIVNL